MKKNLLLPFVLISMLFVFSCKKCETCIAKDNNGNEKYNVSTCSGGAIAKTLSRNECESIALDNDGVCNCKKGK